MGPPNLLSLVWNPNYTLAMCRLEDGLGFDLRFEKQETEFSFRVL